MRSEDIGLCKRPAPTRGPPSHPASAGEAAPAARRRCRRDKGTEGRWCRFRSALSIPGDAILGMFGRSGIVIHRRIARTSRSSRATEKWVDFEWCGDIDAEFPVAIRLEAINQRGRSRPSRPRSRRRTQHRVRRHVGA